MDVCVHAESASAEHEMELERRRGAQTATTQSALRGRGCRIVRARHWARDDRLLGGRWPSGGAIRDDVELRVGDEWQVGRGRNATLCPLLLGDALSGGRMQRRRGLEGRLVLASSGRVDGRHARRGRRDEHEQCGNDATSGGQTSQVHDVSLQTMRFASTLAEPVRSTLPTRVLSEPRFTKTGAEFSRQSPGRRSPPRGARCRSPAARRAAGPRANPRSVRRERSAPRRQSAAP